MSDVKLTVQAGVRTRIWCPVAVELDGDGVSGLKRGEDPIPYQVERLGDGKLRLRFVVERLNEGESAEYTVSLGDGDSSAGGFELIEGDAAIKLLQNGEHVTSYHFGDESSARPYWFPILDPYGKRITRSYPMEAIEGERQDHPHHRSLYVAYGDVNGANIWDEMEGHGTQTHEGWNAMAAGAVFAQLDENVAWRDNAGKVLLDERRVWRWYNLPTSTRVLDAEIDLTPADGVGDVTFGDTKEGGILSVRVATVLDVPKGRIENAVGGINEGETWGKRAHWCDYSGRVNGNLVGIAVFDHPDSFRYPTWWHVRNYGLMTANPFGLSHFTNGAQNGDHVLPAGETLKFRYRVLVHAGDAISGDVATKYHDYIHPPQIKVG